MGSTLILIQQGDPVVAEAELTFIGAGSAGDPDACRRLVYPTGVSPLLPPIVYALGPVCKNPNRTLNLDNVALPHPITDAVLTLGTTRVVRFERSTPDVIITEIWDGSDREAAMTTALLRQLYEYLINPPPVSLTPQYIQWEPRDRSTAVYNVELLSLSVGGGTGEAQLDIADLRDPGGLFRGGTIENALDGLNIAATGIVDREVRLRFKLVSVAA